MSTSKMIDFELSNGHLNGPHVPLSVDDDDYVEYLFDGIPDFPNNVDEEERIFMEAIIKSLKDLVMSHPHNKDQQPSTSSEPSDRVDTSDTSSRENRTFSTIEPAAAGTVSSSVGNGMICKHKFSNSSTSSFSTAVNNVSKESASTEGSGSDNSLSSQSSSKGDASDGTKATVKVVKNPETSIMDRLLRRWDLNFFKSR